MEHWVFFSLSFFVFSLLHSDLQWDVSTDLLLPPYICNSNVCRLFRQCDPPPVIFLQKPHSNLPKQCLSFPPEGGNQREIRRSNTRLLPKEEGTEFNPSHIQSRHLPKPFVLSGCIIGDEQMLDTVSESIALLDDVFWFPELQPEAMVQDQRAAACIISDSDGIGDVDCVAVGILPLEDQTPVPAVPLGRALT